MGQSVGALRPSCFLRWSFPLGRDLMFDIRDELSTVRAGWAASEFNVFNRKALNQGHWLVEDGAEKKLTPCFWMITLYQNDCDTLLI